MARRQPVISYIHYFIRDWGQEDELLNTAVQINKPNFHNELDAWHELLLLVQYIKDIPDSNIRFDAQVKFVRYNIAKIFLDEAPGYELFWAMIEPELGDPVRSLYNSIGCYKNTFI